MNKTLTKITNGSNGLYQLLRNNFGVFTIGFALYCVCSYLLSALSANEGSISYVVSFVSCALYIYLYAVIATEKSSTRFLVALKKMPRLLFKAMILMIGLFLFVQSVWLLVSMLVPDLIVSISAYLQDYFAIVSSQMSDVEKAKAIWTTPSFEALIVTYDKTSALSLALVGFLATAFLILFFTLMSLPLAFIAVDKKPKLMHIAFSSLYKLYSDFSFVVSISILLFSTLAVCFYFSLSYLTPLIYMLFVFFSYYLATKDIVVEKKVKVLTDKEKADEYLLKIAESKKKAAANK